MVDRKKMDRLEKIEAETKCLGKKMPSLVIVIQPWETQEDFDRKMEALDREWSEYGEPPPPEFPFRTLIIGGAHLKKADEGGARVDENPVDGAGKNDGAQ